MESALGAAVAARAGGTEGLQVAKMRLGEQVDFKAVQAELVITGKHDAVVAKELIANHVNAVGAVKALQVLAVSQADDFSAGALGDRADCKALAAAVGAHRRGFAVRSVGAMTEDVHGCRFQAGLGRCCQVGQQVEVFAVDVMVGRFYRGGAAAVWRIELHAGGVVVEGDHVVGAINRTAALASGGLVAVRIKVEMENALVRLDVSGKATSRDSDHRRYA